MEDGWVPVMPTIIAMIAVRCVSSSVNCIVEVAAAGEMPNTCRTGVKTQKLGKRVYRYIVSMI